jgi:predicted protein tyrosine phosphatase
MPKLLVSPLSAVQECIRLHRPSHLVTLLSPEFMIETPRGFQPEQHLRLAVDDVVETWAGQSPPTERHVAQLLDFGRSWDARAPILIHCWAGISRSMGAAFAVLCDRLGPGCEHSVARIIRDRAPHADPNRLIVQIADGMLDRRGQMTKAIEGIGRGRLALEGVTVQLPAFIEPQ